MHKRESGENPEQCPLLYIPIQWKATAMPLFLWKERNGKAFSRVKSGNLPILFSDTPSRGQEGWY